MDIGGRVTHDEMLRLLAENEHLPVSRQDAAWEHNAPILDDLIHDGFVRGPKKSHDGAGAYYSTRGIRLTEKGRARLANIESGAAESEPAPPALRAGFEARALTVLIASPGDTRNARDSVESAIHSWNRDRAHRERIVLLPIRWEADAVPQLGTDGQAVINQQLVDRADIVVALFHSRVGAPTPRAESGTVEEIERAAERGSKVHVYFSEMPHPHGTDPDELKRLNEFRSRMQARGLLGGYVSLDDLTAKIRTALERDIAELVTAPTARSGSTGSVRPQAVMRCRYDPPQHLIIENVGDGPAEDVEIHIEAAGEGEPPQLLGYEPIERILPLTGYELLLAATFETATQWRVRIRWTEDGTTFEENQSVSGF